MSNRRPGDPPLPPPNKTRAGYVIPHQAGESPRIEEYDEPTTQRTPNAPQQPVRPVFVPTQSRPVQHTPGPMPAAPAMQAPVNATPDAGLAPQRPKAQPIEVEYIQETDLQAARNAQWPMLEIWTRNRVYHVDSTMSCIAVINRATGQPEANHSLMGSRLTGGERRSKSSQAVEIYYPFPMPGTEAVFRNESKRNGSYGHTSTIERVVLRVRKMRVGSLDSAPSWDEITGRFTTR
jgi:hypothetical protein